jgi:hypothetical protein
MKTILKVTILPALLLGLASVAYADNITLNSSGCSSLPCTGGALQYLGSASLNSNYSSVGLSAPTSPTSVPPTATGFMTYSVNPASSGNSVWLPAVGSSSWVSFSTTGASYNPNPAIPDDFYYYQTTFSALGGTYDGTLSVMADDTAEVILDAGTADALVLVNFGTVGSDGACADHQPTCVSVDTISLNDISLLNGVNTLTIINAQTGLSAEGVDLTTNLSQTPEPSSLLFMGTGLLGLALVVFWKNKPSGLVLHS